MMLSGVKLTELPQLTQQYEEMLKKPLTEEDRHQVKVDLDRSFGNNQEHLPIKPVLQRVLHASINQGISYTQGMNYIALHVLMFCLESDPTNHLAPEQVDGKFESLVAAIFVHIIHQLKDIFGENLANIFKIMAELEKMLMEIAPEVMFHIAKFGLDATVLFAQNYFSLMMYSSPPHSLAKALLDLFLLEGKNAIHALLVRMLELTTERIIATTSAEKLQKFVKFEIFDVCAEKLDEERKGALCIEDFGLSFY